MPTQQITNAVRTCLTQCYSSSDPLATIAAFTAQLHADPAWTDREIWLVETNVLRLLSLIIDQPDDSADSFEATEPNTLFLKPRDS